MLWYSTLHDMTRKQKRTRNRLNDRQYRSIRSFRHTDVEDEWSQPQHHIQWYVHGDHPHGNGIPVFEDSQKMASRWHSQLDSLLCFYRAMTEGHTLFSLNTLNLPRQLSTHLTSQFRTLLIIELFALTAPEHGKTRCGRIRRWTGDDMEMDMGDYLRSSDTYTLR